MNRILKKVLRPSTLTPARFDMLRIVALRTGIWQRTIRYLLGVSAATVSKMLKALYLEGCITKHVDPTDKRQRVVLITPVGKDLLLRGFDAGIDKYVGEHMVKTAVSFAPHPDLEDETLQKAMLDVEDVIVKTRLAFNDRTTVRNPWRTDDLATMATRPLERDSRPPEDAVKDERGPDWPFEELTSEQVTLLWNPPRGYVPPPPSTNGLVPYENPIR